MSEPDTIERWQAAEHHRDQLQAQLDRLDAPESAELPVEDGERERLDKTITTADAECADAEIAFHRALGDDEQADRLESDRLHADLTATEAASDLLADLREQRGEDPPDEAA